MTLPGGRPPHVDPEMQHPRCVLQLLRKHFARYTPEMVQEICGVPREQFLAVAEALCANSGRERTGAIAYAVGWTQHTVGVQIIRAAAIVQLLLGNIGRPGGGILALRGHANIQGSTDIPTLYNILPSYIPMPHPQGHATLEEFVAKNSPRQGAWGDLQAYTTSLLKAWWGEHATAENDFCFGHLPRINGDHSVYPTMLRMIEGTCRGYFLVGENPAVGNANARVQRHALASLDWLVVRDTNEIESAAFWYDSPEIESGETRTEDIATEVFFLPAAAHTEKDGCFTNTQRLLQWREKAVEPPGDCRSDLQWIHDLGQRIRRKLRPSTDPRDRPVLELTWNYPTHGPNGEPAADAVLQEINGRHADGAFVSKYQELKDDGSTTCGSWLHAGIYADGVNQAARRRPHTEQDWVAREWGWAWPADTPSALQPRLGRPRRAAVVRAQALRLVGRGRGRVDRPRPRRLPAGQGAGLRARAGRDGHGRDPRHRALHRPPRRPRLAVGAVRARRRPRADALRAARVAVRQPAVRPEREPAAPDVPRPRQPVQPERRRARGRGLPLRHDHPPPHRAPHRGGDVADRHVPLGAPAGDVLRGRAGARRRARARARRLGDARDRARGDRGPGARHRPDAPAAGHGPRRAPDRRALPLGAPRPRDRRRGQRAHLARAGLQRPHLGVQDADVRHRARPPASRPELTAFVAGYRRRAGVAS